MAHTRRSLLQTTALGCGALGMGLPGFTSARPLAEPCEFDGPGLYLYPIWGDAQAYWVTRSAAATPSLEFRDPASLRLLWTQTLSLIGR